MSTLAAAAPGTETPSAVLPAQQQSTILAWSALTALWLFQVPLFLAMPLTNDAAIYDIHARHVLEGGVLYRDLFETNLPGVVWLHMLVRSTLGWSSTALRAFDLAMWTATLSLAAWHLRRLGASSRLVLWTSIAMSAFYFSASEWVHCQRDTWLLVPALAALALRARQSERLAKDPTVAGVAWAALAEGLVWGVAVWIKPHVLLPAAGAWFLVACDRRRWRWLAVDAVGLVCGGLAAGALGIAWLVQTEAWPAFVQTARDWNPRYVAAGKQHWTLPRLLGMTMRMFPWLFVHLAGLVAVVGLAARWLRTRSEGRDGARCGALLATCYALWTFQAFVLQHLFDYVHAPPIVLAMLVAAALAALWPRRAWAWSLAGALAMAILVSPLMRANRWSAWTASVNQGSTPELRDRLRGLATPEWQYQEQVAEWLEGQGVRSGDVLCVNDSLVHLYSRLAIRPATRFPYIEQSYFLFPEYRDELRQIVQSSPHRFAVVNLVESGLSYQAAHAVRNGDPLAAPPSVRQDLQGAYPRSHKIVYRAGPYLVFQIEQPVGALLLPAPQRASKVPPRQDQQAG